MRTWSWIETLYRLKKGSWFCDNIKIGQWTENKNIIMDRDRIKVEGRIMVVDNIKIGKRTENKGMIME
jgi:hypothetical protein